MNTSIHDFDTRFAPFEAFAPFTPYAPFALMAWFAAAPAQWWANAFFNTCSMLSEAMVTTMTYPFTTPGATYGPHAHNSEQPEALRKLG